MPKEIIKRNYKYLWMFLIHLIIFFGVQFIFNTYLKDLNLDLRSRISNDYENFGIIFGKKRVAMYLYAGFLFLSVFLNAIILLKKKNQQLYKDNDKSLIGLWLFYAVFSTSLIIYNIYYFKGDIGEGNLYKDYLLSYLQFVPYLVVIFFTVIKGERIDITEKVIEKENLDLKSTLTELEQLKKSELIDQKEFDNKKTELLKLKTRKEIELSEEYDLLKSLNKKGVLSNNEMNSKINSLIEKKLKTHKNGKSDNN